MCAAKLMGIFKKCLSTQDKKQVSLHSLAFGTLETGQAQCSSPLGFLHKFHFFVPNVLSEVCSYMSKCGLGCYGATFVPCEQLK